MNTAATTHDYFLQTDKSQSIRRYPKGSETGERWDKEKRAWSKDCAPRESCLLTGDIPMNESEANHLL